MKYYAKLISPRASNPLVSSLSREVPLSGQTGPSQWGDAGLLVLDQWPAAPEHTGDGRIARYKPHQGLPADQGGDPADGIIGRR